jgi:Domain of Unknown Function (DUF1206)
MVDKSEKIVWLARLGYAVRGVVYILVGYLALSSASEQVRDGTGGALTFIRSIPGGTAILYVSALGLVGYAIYKLIAALYDTENLGGDAKGVAQRAAYLVSAVIYAALSWTALRLATGAASQAGDRNHELASAALSFDLGPVALGLAGVALIGGAVFQAKSAVDASFMRHISSQAPQATRWIGCVGLATRALVFLLMGWSLLRSGWFADSGEVRSLGQAILDMRAMGALYTIVGAGISLFGVFSLITARYRAIPDPEAKLRSGPRLRPA